MHVICYKLRALVAQMELNSNWTRGVHASTEKNTYTIISSANALATTETTNFVPVPNVVAAL